MRRNALIRAGLIVSLLCMAPFSGYGVAAERLHISPSHETEMSRVVEGSKVTIEYIATVPGSVRIDYGNVSEFIQGQHEIFPVLEREVAGMKPGEEKQVEMSPEESFGSRDDRKKLNVPKTLLPLGAKEGDILRNDLGQLATVEEVSETMAMLDYNHPLAGKPVVVLVKILKVENP